ncbi:gamma-glutamylcyclotransferase a [Nerophis ophidion]|uniref:gamma-glutamylcyclotransferase a n=1 Tax=Nerophis ophidion TaxID=159077 RepID=UPI002AE05ADB|nr:gamma-glutamylcyclotransferase a [Nerophis ophidion]
MSKSDDDGTFMYFAFGSNLLKERLQGANPSATFCTTARLKDYKLEFGVCETIVRNIWHGGVATIRHCPGSEVWGVVWSLSNRNKDTLDEQEGVSRGVYSPLEVWVESGHGDTLCRTYQLNNFQACPPSPPYKQVVCWGARQQGLPVEYRERLQALETNNYTGPSFLDNITALELEPPSSVG